MGSSPKIRIFVKGIINETEDNDDDDYCTALRLFHSKNCQETNRSQYLPSSSSFHTRPTKIYHKTHPQKKETVRTGTAFTLLLFVGSYGLAYELHTILYHNHDMELYVLYL